MQKLFTLYSFLTGLGVHHGPSLWVIIMAVICIVALMLPLESDMHSADLPHYLLLTVNQKLLAAFILGRQAKPRLQILLRGTLYPMQRKRYLYVNYTQRSVIDDDDKEVFLLLDQTFFDFVAHL